jgi:hypothetical protein
MVFGVLLVAAGGYVAYRHHQKKRGNKRCRSNNSTSAPNPNLPINTQYGTPRQQMWDDELPAYQDGHGKPEMVDRKVPTSQPQHQQDWEARYQPQQSEKSNQMMVGAREY